MKEQAKQLIDRVVPFLKNYWLKFLESKFYQNKKVFLPVSIAAGLIVLTILLGLIFGGKKAPQVIKSGPSPTPSFTESTNTATPSTDATTQVEQKLTDLKNQIGNLDVKQSRLQPPTLDFKIKF